VIYDSIKTTCFFEKSYYLYSIPGKALKIFILNFGKEYVITLHLAIKPDIFFV